MAGKNFDSAIKSSMNEQPRKAPGTGKPRPLQTGGGKARKPAPEPKNPAADLKEDRTEVAQAGPPRPPQAQAAPPMQPMHAAMPPDAHHVGAAAGIAHAILNRSPSNGGF